MSEDARGSEDLQKARPSSQARRAPPPLQKTPDYAAYTQSSMLGAFSQAYASTHSGPSLSRFGLDALHSRRQSLPLAPVHNALDLLSLEGQQHRPRTEVTASGQIDHSSFPGLPDSPMDSQFSFRPDVSYHPSQPSPFSASPTHPSGFGRHPAAFSAPSLLVPSQQGLSFPSGAHPSLLPTTFPCHHPASATTPLHPGSKMLVQQHYPQVSAAQGDTMSTSRSLLSSRSTPHYSQPLVKQLLTAGPSRKPPYRAITETGFVMWVGNLESSASLDELCIFFRQIDPTPLPSEQSAVVSIMYMPSTNCALVNMRNEATLREAVERFHGSRLRPNTKSARLVCRRRCSEMGSESSLVKTSASGPSSSARQKSTLTNEIPEGSRFFVLKSIDHASVKQSVQTSRWSTQLHNEPILNEALRRSPAVYLVFGVNKTGEFFGYAKMVAPIQRRSENHRLDGTIVHLADMADGGANNESISCPIANLIGKMRPTQGEKDGWGTPFPIKWICTETLGFTRIRHIRNGWNNDREIKVSRDGQELSPDCGRVLLEEWARPWPPTERSGNTLPIELPSQTCF